MNKGAGMVVAVGALAALGLYFAFRNKANAATLAVGAGGPGQPSTSGANLAASMGLSQPTLSTASMLPVGISSMTSPVGGTIYYQTAMSAPTTSGIAASSSFWNTLTPIAAPTGGWLIDPAGSQAPASLLPWRKDAAGRAYVMWGVDVYQAQGPDSNGNYTGVPVAGTSSALAFG